MKRRGMLALLSSTVAVSFMATVISTLAWFNTTINVSPEDKLSGFSDGAYFAGGDGLTAETAFIIRTPRHLYNLAWLQYLGYFNEDKKNNTTGAAGADGVIDQQYYFILDNDLDMNPGDSAKTQWTIPPIGTQKYPFVGTFIGNNKTITDLRISNFFNDYNKTPSVIKSSADIKDVNIVGFFGVVGTISATGNSINKTDTGVETYTYNNSAVSITNIGLDNLEVKSSTSNTLIGLAAGYVNGSVSGVAVKESKITTNGNSRLTGFGTSTNLSEYSLAGFVRDQYLNIDGALQKNVTAETPQVDNEVVSGSGDDFGASIAMNTMYKNLLGLKQDGSENYYNTSEVYFDNVIDDSKTERTEFKVSSNSFVSNSETDTSGNKVSSFTFYDRGSSYDNFMYLYGEKSVNYNETKTYINTMTSVPTSSDSFCIRSGDNYLSTSITNTTYSNAPTWTYNNGKIYSGSTYLRYNYGLTTTTDPNNASNWTITYNDDNTFNIYYENNSRLYYINYNNSSWEATEITQFYFKYNDYYMKLNETSSGNNQYSPYIYSTTNVSEATIWVINNSQQYYPNGRSNWLLGYCDDEWPLQAFTDTTTTTYGVAYTYDTSTGYLGGYRYNYYRYAKYGETQWTSSSSTNQNTAQSGASVLERIPITNSYKVGLCSKSSTVTAKTFTAPSTYFPLSYEPAVDAQNNPILDSDKDPTYTDNISSKNTGYVVSGSYYASQPGDIRVSKYANANRTSNGENYRRLRYSLNDSYYYQGNAANKTMNLSVVTRSPSTNGLRILKDDYNFANGNGTVSSTLTNKYGSTKISVADAGLVKYAASRKQIHNLFSKTINTSGTTYLYGLHFMNAQISASHKITIPYASINGVDYYDYELPNDCIDFTLKNNGYINFFAGSYFTGNTTFFSLHNIIRDENTKAITGIKEISKIYKNVGANRKQFKYIYEYNTNPKTYNCALGTGDNEGIIETDKTTHEPVVLFDTDWITNPDMLEGALFYFELPANKGEYALGSVSGKDGAYLIYLDIGAGVKTQNITTYTEKITTTTKVFSFVKGIDFVAVIPTTADGFNALKGDLVANVSIPGSTNGTTTFGYNASTSILRCGPPNGVTLASTYISYGVTVQIGDNPQNTLTAAYNSSSTVVLDKKTEIIYDNDAETVTKIVSYSTDGGDTWQSDEPVVLDTDVQDYTAATTIESAGVEIVHFHYQVTSEATVTLVTDYNSETDTYTITLTSSVATTIYIDNVLASANVGGIDVNYTVIINNVTVHTGSNPIPVTAS